MDEKFGDASSRLDGAGDFITIPDTDVDFYLGTNLTGFEGYVWLDRDGVFHVEIHYIKEDKYDANQE